MASTDLLYRFLGIDAGAGAQFDRMAGKTAMLGEASAATSSKVKALAAGTAVAGVAIGVAAVKMASDYQRSMTMIQTQAGASKSEVESFSKSLLTLAPKVAQSPDDLATSLYHVYSALKKVGATGPQMLNTVKIAAEGAKVGNTDLEDTTNSLTATLASGIVRFNQAAKAMGYLNATVGAGDMHFSDLNQALGTGLLVTMKTFGVSMKDTGAALAVFGDNNIRGADAATKLRMAVQDLTKPAANSDEVLAKVGLTADKLRQTLQDKGLNGALQLLRDKLDAAGVTGKQVGGFLEDAFTKKAGAGLAILITRLEQFDEARKQETVAASGFGDAWKATTQTAAFAFDRLKSEAEAMLIQLGTKLLPVVTDAANWLGAKLPAAIRTLADILGPTVHLIGDGLAVAWQAVSAVLGGLISSMSSVAHWLQQHKTLATAVTTTVLAMWAAFKLAALATAGLRLIGPLLTSIGVRAFTAGAAIKSGFTGGNVAIVAATAALGVLVMTWQKNQQRAAENTAAIEGYTQALNEDSGAIAKNVRAQAESNLVSKNGYALAKAFGITQAQLTDAVLAQGSAYERAKAQILDTAKANGANSVSLYALNGLLQTNHQQLGTAIQDHKDVAAAAHAAADAHRAEYDATHRNIDAVSRLSGGLQTLATNSRDAATAAHGATMGMNGQTTSAKEFDRYLRQLTTDYQKLTNTELSQRQAQLSFKQGLLDLKQQVKDYGTSLSDATTKGNQNQQTLVGLLSSAESAAEGSKNYGQALLGNVQAFIAFATKAGYSKTQVDKLLGSLKLMPHQIRTSLHVETRDAFAQIENFVKTPWTTYVQVVTTGNHAPSGGHALGQDTNQSGRSGFGRDFMPPQAGGLALLSPRAVQQALNQQKRLTDALAKDLHNRASAIKSLASNIGGSADLGGLFGTDKNGNPKVRNVNRFLSNQAGRLKKFANDLKWAERHGLSGALLSQIAALGPDEGDQVLKQFRSGGASITAANRAERHIQQYAQAGATTVEDRVYAKRIAEDRKNAKEQTDVLKEIRHLLAVAQRHPGSSTARLAIEAKMTPKLDRQFVQELIKMIRREERTAGKKLI